MGFNGSELTNTANTCPAKFYRYGNLKSAHEKMKEKLAGLARYGDVGHARKRRRSGLGGVGRHEDGMGGEMKSGERAPSDLLVLPHRVLRWWPGASRLRALRPMCLSASGNPPRIPPPRIPARTRANVLRAISFSVASNVLRTGRHQARCCW